MKILVTGASGFVGNNICKYFSKLTDYEVIGISRSGNHKLKDIKYIEADISNSENIELLHNNIDSVDIIVHCAACIDKNDFNPELIKVNCQGTLNILELAKIIQAKKLVYISSIPVIGTPKDIPIDENHLQMPTTSYHASKLMGENIALMGSKYGINAVSLRLPSPVGKGMNPNTILPVFVKKCLENKDIEILGNGERIQNYIDIKDICEAVYRCIIKDVNGIFNIASNESYSNKELANICKFVLKSNSKIILSGGNDPEELNKWIISIEKAKRLFDFNPTYKIEDTIIDIAKELVQ